MSRIKEKDIQYVYDVLLESPEIQNLIRKIANGNMPIHPAPVKNDDCIEEANLRSRLPNVPLQLKETTEELEKYKNFLNPNGTIITDNIKFHGYVGESSKLDKGNLKSLVEKIENYIEFLKSNTEFDTKFYDIGDGLSVSTWKHE